MKKYIQKAKVLGLLCLTITLIVTLALTTHSGSASAQDKTLTQPTGIKGMATNATNIVLVDGAWSDGSAWSKEIPILEKAGHRFIAVQLPASSLQLHASMTEHFLA